MHRPSIKHFLDKISMLFTENLEKNPAISIEFARLNSPNDQAPSLVKKLDHEIYQDIPNDC